LASTTALGGPFGGTGHTPGPSTWNNDISDMADNTLIDPGSPLFQTASSMKPGQTVQFSGHFFSGSEGECLKEGSITLSGKLREPEFIFQFSSISSSVSSTSFTESARAQTATPTTEQPSVSLPASVGVPSSVWDAARSSVSGAGTATKRLPLPPDSSSRGPKTADGADAQNVTDSAQDQSEKQALVQAAVHSAAATDSTSAPDLPSNEIVKPSPARDFPNPSDYYPAESIRMREAGSPLVHVCVGPDGEVADEPTIVTSSGSARLDAGALQLAKAGHYNPGTEDAKPVTACINMAVKFQLRKSP
jgi:TonB family protein